MKHVVIVGGGFGGLNAAKKLGRVRDVEVTLIDERNHHLFQPLLYQVAMAGLSPAEIAVPIRSLLARYANTRVLRARVTRVDPIARCVETDDASVHPYDVLVLACGARHSYFGHEDWEPFAPGLKTLPQATEIRRRVLDAFEEAEKEDDPERRRALLTFVVVGGGPTGVELAGAIGEMSRYTLARDFRRIDPTLARVMLIEAGPRILPAFEPPLASRAARDLESLGVQIWTSSAVSDIDADGVQIGAERIQCATALWAAGVRASPLGAQLAKAIGGVEIDRSGRVCVALDLSLPGHPEIFVIGDQAHLEQDGEPLPGLAPVALQQGHFVARQIQADLAEHPRETFHYVDKGKLATIGRGRAVGEVGRFTFSGPLAWLAWLVVHIYYLVGFKNRIFVVLQWAWAYVRFRRGARLITTPNWQFHPAKEIGGRARQAMDRR